MKTRRASSSIWKASATRGFLSAPREVALAKPIIVIKAGRTQQAAQAAASHTGTLAGSDAVLDAAFSRCGVLRVDTIAEVFSMAEVLGKQPRPRGPRLSILTNAGGPGVLATDALIQNGCELAPISAETLDELNTFLPAPWSHGNPIDILGDADAKRYAQAVETRLAESADEAVEAARDISFPVVLKLHSTTLTHKTDVGGVLLNLLDENAVREAFVSIENAVREKSEARFFEGVTVQPMVKLDGYELILGSSADAQFGPILLFGSGGQLVEVYRDSALALPPLTSTLARRLMERTKVFTALQGVRGRASIDLTALESLLVQFSRLVVENPRIKEIDINPLLASPEKLLALDARVVLYPASTRDEDLSRPAIRPYPSQYAGEARLKDGDAITIRPIRPEDEPLLRDFHETLSEQSVYQRYLQPLGLNQRVAHERLIRVCFSDYDRDIALVAENRDDNGNPRILGVARFSRGHNRDSGEAEFALLISDDVQRQGLGSELLRRLMVVARAEDVRVLAAPTRADNEGMQALCRKLGFSIEPTESAERVLLKLEL